VQVTLPGVLDVTDDVGDLDAQRGSQGDSHDGNAVQMQCGQPVNGR
jgi:hypothetical protein